jgi:transposase
MRNKQYLCIQKNAMIQLNIKPEDKQVIAEGRYTQPHPRVMQKYDALRLKDCGLSNSVICTVLGICNNTLLSFFKQYNEGGLTRLNEIKFNQPESDLKAFSTTIAKYLEENPPRSISEAAAKIELLTGVKRGETQVRKFLKEQGFRFRRIGTVPAKALPEEKKTNRETFRSKS